MRGGWEAVAATEKTSIEQRFCGTSISFSPGCGAGEPVGLTIDVMTSTLLCPDLCPECSYPQLAPGLCYFCVPVVDTSVIAFTTVRRPREPRAGAERSVSNGAAGTFAAAG
jgi:hypothetical protein